MWGRVHNKVLSRVSYWAVAFLKPYNFPFVAQTHMNFTAVVLQCSSMLWPITGAWGVAQFENCRYRLVTIKSPIYAVLAENSYSKPSEAYDAKRGQHFHVFCSSSQLKMTAKNKNYFLEWLKPIYSAVFNQVFSQCQRYWYDAHFKLTVRR